MLLSIDTLRADHLSAYGYPRTTSTGGTGEQKPLPAPLSIDALANEGVRFAECFAPRGQTFPSTASLMTGQTPFEHGALDNFDTLSSEATTLAELMRAAGFATGGFTTNRLLGPAVDAAGRLGAPSGIEQGFQTFVRDFSSPDRDLRAASSAAQWIGKRYEARAAGDAAPFFAWLHLMGPHKPYAPLPLRGRDFATEFGDPDYSGPANGSHDFLDGAYAAGRPLTGVDIEHVVSLYDGEIARMDFLIGLLLNVVQGYGSEGGPAPLDETLVVFTADHGEELYQRSGYWAHSKSVYSSVLHVPLFFRHPASLTGMRVLDNVVELRDVAPTVLDWFDLQPPAGWTGRSLLAAMDTYIERPFEQRSAVGHWRDSIFSLRDDEWRLVWNPQGLEPDDPPVGRYPIPELALFDVSEDPLELRDVAAEHPDVVDALLEELVEFIEAQPVPTGSRVAMDPGRRAALLELGYMHGDLGNVPVNIEAEEDEDRDG